ncbi:hypothetical protein GA707_18095 [Nostocoides sp. F2B08]|uniref:hypothetical protein n=1 Tax=Nostocoides sp. F2B08 TaxID=2653936 RepID=UPI0012636273|nr:hypothetical protein [Tetrasphaera sp. F2B08]KAB7741455.1 hypothetical protein GA707_18095 [Tetrasphaera sp. F2B08]
MRHVGPVSGVATARHASAQRPARLGRDAAVVGVLLALIAAHSVQTAMHASTMARQESPFGPDRERMSAVVRQITVHWMHRSMQRLIAAGSPS